MLTIEPRSAASSSSALLLERAGLKITPDGYHGLRLALTARMPALGISDAEEYVRRLRSGREHELRSLLPLVTVGHTEFFRDPQAVPGAGEPHPPGRRCGRRGARTAGVSDLVRRLCHR